MFNKSKKYESGEKDMALKQGWNSKEGKFWIQIADRKHNIVLRKWLDEEYFQNFHNMGRFTYKQTKKDEGDFEDDEDDWKNIP